MTVEDLKIERFETKAIINRILENENDHWILHTSSLIDFYENDPSSDYQLLATKLDNLFKQGAILSHYLYTNTGGEGGECFLGYIVKPEYKDHYQYEYDTKVFDDEIYNWFNVFESWYISNNPKKVILVWAGAY